MTKDTVNILSMLQNIPAPETLSTISSIVSKTTESFDTISSIASIVEDLSLPILETNPLIHSMMDMATILSDQIGKIGSSFEPMHNIAMPIDGLGRAATIPYPDGITKFAQSYNDSNSPSSSSQRVLSTPSTFRSPFLSNTSSSSQIHEDDLPALLKAKRSRLECIINNCYFEPGISTEADEYFSGLWNDMEINALKVLSEIVNENLDNEHMLEGVLHILSSLPYAEISPIGITIGIACGFNHSPLVIDRLIACFEDWEDPAAIRILESMDLSSTPWLSNYRDKVTLILKQKI